MFEVKNIRIQMRVGIMTAVIVFMLSGFVFHIAQKCSKSYYYYWSGDLKNMVSIMNVLGIFLLFIGIVLMGVGLAAAILINTGKVCPDCEKVYMNSAVVCPRCNRDLRYAKSIREYLVEKSKNISRGAAGTVNQQPIGRQYHVKKRFCAYCGEELLAEAVFCPHCGNKGN